MIANRILTESASGYTEHDLGALLAANGKLYLDEDITTESVMRFIPLLQYMEKEQKEVTVYLNSRGGEIDAGLAIYVMRFRRTRTRLTSFAWSLPQAWRH